jgi:hypothetical protein
MADILQPMILQALPAAPGYLGSLTRKAQSGRKGSANMKEITTFHNKKGMA